MKERMRSVLIKVLVALFIIGCIKVPAYAMSITDEGASEPVKIDLTTYNVEREVYSGTYTFNGSLDAKTTNIYRFLFNNEYLERGYESDDENIKVWIDKDGENRNYHIVAFLEDSLCFHTMSR